MDKPVTTLVWGPFSLWRPEYAGMGIPEFLILSSEQRKKAWEGAKLTDPRRGGNVEDWEKRVALDKENREAEKKTKNEKGLTALKAKHAGERYNRKTKTWEKITVTVTEN